VIVGGAAVVIAVRWPASCRGAGRQPALWRWKVTRPRLLVRAGHHDPVGVAQTGEPAGLDTDLGQRRLELRSRRRDELLHRLPASARHVGNRPQPASSASCFGGEELVDAAHDRRLRDDL